MQLRWARCEVVEKCDVALAVGSPVAAPPRHRVHSSETLSYMIQRRVRDHSSLIDAEGIGDGSIVLPSRIVVRSRRDLLFNTALHLFHSVLEVGRDARQLSLSQDFPQRVLLVLRRRAAVQFALKRPSAISIHPPCVVPVALA